MKRAAGTFHSAHRERLRKYYRGNTDELLPEIFPKPATTTKGEYDELCGYFVYVNLLKPSIARLVSGVYGNPVSRIIEAGSPYKDKVDAFLAPSRGYSIKVRDAFRNAVHYGDGIIIFTIKDGEVVPYCPNPIRTKIFTDPADVHDVVAIIEECGDSKDGRQFTSVGPTHYRFVTKSSYGVMDARGEIIDTFEHGIGVVPAVIFYGEDQRAYGEAHGDSLVSSGAKYSSVVSRLLLNMVELVLTFTDPKGVLKGVVTNPDEAMDKGAIMALDQAGSFNYESPDTNFRDLSDTITAYLTYYCISEGIPLDALNPSSVPENQSATSARLRNQPLSVTINRLIEEQVAREAHALAIVAALYQFLDTKVDVTFPDVVSKFRASIMIQASGNPESQAEEAQSWQVLLSMGAKELSDAIRHFNPTASEGDIARRLNTAIEARDALLKLQPDKSQAENNTEDA